MRAEFREENEFKQKPLNIAALYRASAFDSLTLARYCRMAGDFMGARINLRQAQEEGWIARHLYKARKGAA